MKMIMNSERYSLIVISFWTLSENKSENKLVSDIKCSDYTPSQKIGEKKLVSDTLFPL